jgi:molybdopterin converting factor small subunit
MESVAGFAQLELPSGATLRVAAGQTVLEALQAERVELRQPAILVANGQTADFTYQLQAGDIVRLIPQIAGG